MLVRATDRRLPMSTPIAPKLLRGGIVQIDPGTGTVLRVIALQYNPDTLTRTLQVQASGETGDRSEALRLKGAAVETIKLEAEIDATDQLEDPDANPDAVDARHPPAARRARGARPPDAPTQLQANDALAGAGVLEVLPLEAPLTLFVWSEQRVVPVRVTDLSVTEEAFDVALNPIRAKVSLGLRVLSVDDLGFGHRGGTLFMAYLQHQGAPRGRAPSRSSLAQRFARSEAS